MTKRENPFRYGIAVDDPYFVDREQELKGLFKMADLRSESCNLLTATIREDLPYAKAPEEA